MGNSNVFSISVLEFVVGDIVVFWKVTEGLRSALKILDSGEFGWEEKLDGGSCRDLVWTYLVQY